MKAVNREVRRSDMKRDIIDELFRRYYNEALLYVMTLCRNRTVAEDVVSAAFFRALESADDSIRDFRPWLLAVCRNEYLSQLRKTSRESGEASEELAAESEQMIESIIRQEEYRALYRAIDTLNESQKEVITLFYFSGLSVREIAQVTGKSETNAKVTLCRAREALKKSMEAMR